MRLSGFGGRFEGQATRFISRLLTGYYQKCQGRPEGLRPP